MSIWVKHESGSTDRGARGFWDKGSSTFRLLSSLGSDQWMEDIPQLKIIHDIVHKQGIDPYNLNFVALTTEQFDVLLSSFGSQEIIRVDPSTKE